jgi:hypothetical protein
LQCQDLGIREHHEGNTVRDGLVGPSQVSSEVTIGVAKEQAALYNLLAWDEAEEVDNQLGTIPDSGGQCQGRRWRY